MISIILPTYNEEQNIVKIHERLAAVANSMVGNDFEFIFVDDCSMDGTPGVLKEVARADERVKIIRFARNCGSHAAVTAGLHLCTGNVAIMLAADLQDPPEIIFPMIAEWEKGAKIVWGVRERREGEGLLTRTLSRLFYYLMNRLTDIRQPPTGADVFLVDKDVIAAFRTAPEKNTSVYMLIAWLGFSQSSITYIKEVRHAGTSKWTTSQRFKLFFDSLISFSYIPLRVMSLMGVFFSSLGFLYGFFLLYNAINGIPVAGWSSLMITVLFVGGFQMIMMGMLGEYLWRTYDEARGRPRFVIEKNTLSEKSSTSPGVVSDIV